jgi:hypothetical protein
VVRAGWRDGDGLGGGQDLVRSGLLQTCTQIDSDSYVKQHKEN